MHFRKYALVLLKPLVALVVTSKALVVPTTKKLHRIQSEINFSLISSYQVFLFISHQLLATSKNIIFSKNNKYKMYF